MFTPPSPPPKTINAPGAQEPLQNGVFKARKCNFWQFEGWGTWFPPLGACLYRRWTSRRTGPRYPRWGLFKQNGSRLLGLNAYLSQTVQGFGGSMPVLAKRVKALGHQGLFKPNGSRFWQPCLLEASVDPLWLTWTGYCSLSRTGQSLFKLNGSTISIWFKSYGSTYI